MAMAEPTTITARKVTRYQIGGKGRTFGSITAAYRSAAIARVVRACEEYGEEDSPAWHCRYCDRVCEQHKSLKHIEYNPQRNGDDADCSSDPSHTYRYRLVGRLARWLRWADERRRELEEL